MTIGNDIIRGLQYFKDKTRDNFDVGADIDKLMIYTINDNVSINSADIDIMKRFGWEYIDDPEEGTYFYFYV